MKKGKVIAALSVLLGMSAIALVACDGKGGEHAHTFDDEWTTDGTSHWHECTVDGCSEKSDEVAHTFGTATPVKPATCYEKGTETYACSVCDYVKTVDTDMTEHAPALVWSYDGVSHWHACETDGCTEHLNNTVHDWGDWTVENDNKPTLAVGGKATHACETDGCGGTGEYALPALTSSDYNITGNTATINAGGVGTYVYDKNGVSVSFEAETAALPSLAVAVTVLDADGEPVDGVNVVLQDTLFEGVTNADGIAAFKAEYVGSGNFYLVELENTPAGLVYGKVKVTDDSYEVTVYLATSLDSGDSEENAKSVDLGIHAVTVNARRDQESGEIATVDRYLKYTAAEAGTYTLTLLDDGSYASIIVGNSSDLIEPRGTFSVVLEEGDVVYYSFVSDDGIVESGYRQPVVFEIAKSAAPALGVVERPIRLQSGVAGQCDVSSADQKVFFRLNSGEYGKYAKLEFNDDVSVYWLGFSLSGATGTSVESGGIVKVSEYGHSYLYAVGTGSSVSVTATAHYVDGMAQKPIVAKLDGTENEVDIGVDGETEMWFSFTAETDGRYVVKPSSSLASFELYNAVTDENYVKRSGAGAAITLTLKADTTVYLRATELDLNAFTFTCAPESDDDVGLSKDSPIEVTSGDYTLNSVSGDVKTTYLKYTAQMDCVVTLTHAATQGMPAHYIYMTIYGNSDYSSDRVGNTQLFNVVANKGVFKYSFEMNEGDTYYIAFQIENLAVSYDPKLNVSSKEIAPHDYQVNILYPDGETGVSGVTVKLYNGDELVATQTTNNVGRVTFAEIDAHYDYTLVLENLPAKYGYYSDQVKIAKNYDDITVFNLTLTAYVDYKVTFKLPDGTAAEGVEIVLSSTHYETFSGTTDANGVYAVSALPPFGAAEYSASFTLPDALAETYYTPAAVSVRKNNPELEIVLAEYMTVTITVVDDSGNAIEGATVNVGDLTGTTNAEGKASISGVSPVKTYSFAVTKAGYAIYKVNGTVMVGQSSHQISEAKKDSFVLTCLYVGDGKLVTASSLANAPAIAVGNNVAMTTSSSMASVKFVADTESDSVTYRITVTSDISMYGVSAVYLNGTTTRQRVFNQGSYSGSGKTIITSEKMMMNMLLCTFTITLNKDDVIYLTFNGVGTMNVAIAEVTA